MHNIMLALPPLYVTMVLYVFAHFRDSNLHVLSILESFIPVWRSCTRYIAIAIHRELLRV